MTTKREIIDSLRQKLAERHADSNFSNWFLYQSLLEQAKWIIKRDLSNGKLYSNPSLLQTLPNIEIVEVSKIDECSPVKTKCKIYRTKNKLPKMWEDDDGPAISDVKSLDGSTSFFYTNITTWQAKLNDPYQKMIDQKYTFFSDGYLWFSVNPHFVTLYALFVDDISNIRMSCKDCPEEECVRFLDTRFIIPPWSEAECINKAFQLIAGGTERLPKENQIDKNDTRKN